MRFLADMPISRSTVYHLRSQNHDVIHLLDLGLEQAKDHEIAELAAAQERVLLTMDLDFGAIIAASKAGSPSVVIFRLRDNRPAIVNDLLDGNLSQVAASLEQGAIAVFEVDKVRVRNLPI